MSFLEKLRKVGKVAAVALAVTGPGSASVVHSQSNKAEALLDGHVNRGIIFDNVAQELKESPDLVLSGHKRIPEEYLRICADMLKTYEEICTPVATDKLGDKIPFNEVVLQILDRVNFDVNSTINPITDLKLHGVLDKWVTGNICQAEGDCEEFVLCKFYTLLGLKFPKNKLRLAFVENIVPDPTSPVRFHLLLLVAVAIYNTEKYLVLDNQYHKNAVYTLTKALEHYRFISVTNPMWTDWSGVSIKIQYK